ncbi:MAG: amidohydrolase [Acidobacteria bacterium]|nr:amidohydrolase [Acidobacteriota bacterium]
MRRVFRWLAFVVALLVIGGAAAFYWVRVQRSRADLVLRGGRIITLDESMPEAPALAAREGRIVAIGSARDVEPHIGWWTRVIDLDAGALAIPGLIEGHGHFAALGEYQTGLDLLNATSWDGIVAQVAAAVARARPGQWIVGRGWHQEKWTAVPRPSVEGFPTHASLDAVSPDNPVVLRHASGHAAFVNARAMALSDITRSTGDPAGGQILKDAGGDPTGLLRETAAGLVRQGAGEPRLTDDETAARLRQILVLADREASANGITSFHDAGTSLDVIEQMKRMIDVGALQTRLWVMLRVDDSPPPAATLAEAKTLGYGDHHLTVRALKYTMDGALGSRGAWLLDPYADAPGSVGLPRSLDVLRQTAALAAEGGYQLAVHAIGDRASREVLNVFEDAFKTSGKIGRDLRWRVEHAQHLSAADIPRFGQLGVIASMQAVHATSDAPFVRGRLGDARAAGGAYVWRKLMESGAIVTNGTDVPVERIDPIANYYAAVTRTLADGTVFYGDQTMSRLDALRAYTIRNAYAAFEDDLKGTLSPGKLADITVLTKDITTVPAGEIRAAKVAYTIVGGRVVYDGGAR